MEKDGAKKGERKDLGRRGGGRGLVRGKGGSRDAGEEGGKKARARLKQAIGDRRGKGEDGKLGLECGKTNECFRLDALQK